MTSDTQQLDPQKPTPELLIWAYTNGVFPMADPHTGVIDWYSPDPRGVIPLDEFHVPKSLARIVRSAPYDIRSDTAFEEVMRACAKPRADDNETWIDERLIAAYVDLHKRGDAHSVEAWADGQLVGGLYGVHLGSAFFGESMFTRRDGAGTNASKVCLVHLVRHLNAQGFVLLDTQFVNDHLQQFGCIEVPREAYLNYLAGALMHESTWEWGVMRGDQC